EWLEGREVPAVTILLDYSFDSSGFFNDPTRRAILQQAVNEVGSHLNAALTAITPGGGNSFTASFFNPANGQQAQVANLSVPANAIVVYVGGRAMSRGEAGVGGNGGYSARGPPGGLATLRGRHPAGVGEGGGGIP